MLNLSTYITIGLLMIVGFILGLAVHFSVICSMYNCRTDSGDFKLPLGGFIAPFKAVGDYNKFNKLFFSITNPYIYVISSMVITTFVVLKFFKTRKISKQVTLNEIN